MQREYVVKTDLELLDPSRQDKYLRDSEMYLGIGVRNELDKLDLKERKADIDDVYKRCKEFLKVAALEIKKRYDFEDKVISRLNCLIPGNGVSNSFREVTPSLYSLIVEVPLIVPSNDKSLMQNIDDQWRLLPAFKSNFDSSLPVDRFWSKILEREDKNFYDLAKFVLDVLGLPHSNAECERLFSKLNLFKTKIRNRLNTDTINGALLSADCIKSQNSCIQFNPSREMVSLIKNSQALYENVKDVESKDE